MAFKMGISTGKMKQMFDEIDIAGDGIVKRDDWINYVSNLTKKIDENKQDISISNEQEKFLGHSQFDLVQLFDKYDRKKKKELSKEDMIKMGRDLGIDKEKMLVIFDEIDFNGDGTIEIQEWLD